MGTNSLNVAVNIEKSKQRIEWIDVLRCLAMYLVVIGHATTGGTPDTYRYYIYSFHMPLFFMISGGAYYLQTRSKEYGFVEMLKNKVRTLVWPYFSLNFFAFWIWVLNFRILSYKDISIPKVIYAVFYSNEHHISAVSNATWFLLTLFLTIIVFFALQLWSHKDEKVLTLAVLIIGSFGYTMSLRKNPFYTPWHLETVPIALILFLLGYLFIKHANFITELLGDTKRQIFICMFCLLGGYFCAKYNVKISMSANTYGSFMLFIGSVIGFSIVCMLIAMWLPKWKLFKFIGRNTIVCLAFHAPVFRFMEVYSDFTKQFLADYPILVGTVVFILMIPVEWIFEKYLPFLVGKKKKVER